jgi:hypothetical protein
VERGSKSKTLTLVPLGVASDNGTVPPIIIVIIDELLSKNNNTVHGPEVWVSVKRDL